MYRKAPKLLSLVSLAAIAATGLAGCGAREGAGPEPLHTVEGDYQLRALSFAGVDLLYALRRIAGETGVYFVFDEVRQPGAAAEDLAMERIDVDLPAGSLAGALQALHQQVPTFDYQVKDRVMLVRSHRALTEVTALDIKGLPAAELDVDIRGLLKWVGDLRPGTYLRDGNKLAQPIRRKAKLSIPADSSVLDVFVAFARSIEWGIRIRRAGFLVEQDSDKLTFAASTVELMNSLARPFPVTPWRDKRATIYSVANLADRTGKVICIIDRSVLFDERGDLNFKHTPDPMLDDFDLSLRRIAEPKHSNRPPIFVISKKDGGVVEVESMQFLRFPTGRKLLEAPLEAGHFEGNLAHLARWINKHGKTPTGKVLMAGEIVPGAPVAKLDIEDGSSIEEVLYDFARLSGEGWNLVIRDSNFPTEKDPGTWVGAYIRRLADWGPKGGPAMP